jgi:adenosylcobinamide-GDP ribazoletransferase
VKRFLVAVQFLTRLPTPRIASDPGDLAASMRWFPAVGALIGAILAGAAWLGLRIDSWTGALAALAAWVAVTGALHLDGLGDIADGIGAAHGDPARLRAALADPHVGSFAVVTIALQLLAKLVLLHALLARAPAWSLVAVPFAARIGPLAWARALPPLHEGLGALFAGIVRRRDLMGWGAILIGAAVATPGLLATFVLVPAYGWWLMRRIGGISGDGHGAGIEIVETGLLLALAWLA